MASRSWLAGVALLIITSITLSLTNLAQASEPDTVDPKAEHFERHRLSLGASVRPMSTITAMGGDGHMSEGKLELLGLVADAGYGLRLLRHLEVGLGASYGLYYKVEKSKMLAHELTIPAHVGVVIPAGRRAEVRLAGHFGWLNYWIPDQEYVSGGGGALHAMGMSGGPDVTGYFGVTDGLDVFVQTRAAWGYAAATNGVSYLEGVHVVSLVVGSGLGVRVRL